VNRVAFRIETLLPPLLALRRLLLLNPCSLCCVVSCAAPLAVGLAAARLLWPVSEPAYPASEHRLAARVRPPPTPMAAPSHLHLHLPGCPQTLALPLPSPGGFSAWPGLRSCSRSRQPRIRPVAALGPADAGDLLGRVEAFLYTVADAAVNAEPVAAAADTGTKEAAAGDWLSGITNSMETVLKVRSRPPPLRLRFRASVQLQLAQRFMPRLRELLRLPRAVCGRVSSVLFISHFLFWDFG
jgi:hypothetical protein